MSDEPQRVLIVHRDLINVGYVERIDDIEIDRPFKVLGRTPEGHYVVEDPHASA